MSRTFRDGDEKQHTDYSICEATGTLRVEGLLCLPT
jgi:hypothetical protein